MSEYENVIVERHDQVAVVTLNRPDSLNAFNTGMLTDLLPAIAEVNDDESIRVGILTGMGRAFSAGADLTEDMGPGFKVEEQLNGQYKPILMSLTNAPQPWISAVNGPAAGVGSAFAMVCDLSVMAEDAYIYQAFTAIGLVPDGGATWHLVHTLGRKRAYELIASGEKMKASKCLDLGLCNRVVPATELLQQALEWARELASKSPLSLRYAKQALNSAMEESLADTISSEAKLQHLCITSEDSREGVAAFTQKRAPQWKGR
ncbi:MAG: enoyl-CoA hydratase/isomerase family protein [Halioglobus sp.]